MNGRIGTICCTLIGVECRAPMLDMDPLNGETTNHASFNKAAVVNPGISMELTRSNEKKQQSVT